MTLKILIDNSVLSAAQIGRWYQEAVTVDWGGSPHKTRVTRMKIELPEDPGKSAQIRALPTITQISKAGSITLTSYAELGFEEMFGRRPARATRGDLFAGVSIETVDPAVDRSYLGGLPFPDGMRGLGLQEFCETLLDPRFDPTKWPAVLLDQLPISSRKSLEDLGRFRYLCRHGQATHYRDLFHVWTGERNHCAYFLTMENRLPNFCSSHVNDVKCRPVRPLDLVHALGIADLAPLPFPNGSSIDAFTAMDIE